MILTDAVRIFSSATIKTLCPDHPDSGSCNTGIPKVALGTSQVQTVLQLVFGIIAVVAVLIIVINAFRLVISQGDPEAVRKTRDGIIAAVIGLVIAISAEIIVSFVLGKT